MSSNKYLLSVLLAFALLPLSVPFAAAQSVPSGMDMVIRLDTPLSTRANRPGDPFTATVVEPDRYGGSIVNGHIRDIDQSGRLKGRTELSLAFDSIQLRRGRTEPFKAQVQNVYESDTVKIVDNEGNIKSGSRGEQTMKRSGIGGAVGGALGGVIGGGKGALLGVLLGAGAGAGSLYAEGAKEIRLDPGTQIEISTGLSSRPRALARTDWDQDPAFVSNVQNALQSEGYDPGNNDGNMTWRTREAIRDFQRDQGLPVTGNIDRETADRLGVR